MRTKTLAATLTLACILVPRAHGHREPSADIAAASATLRTTPDDAGAYLRRGELYLEYRDWSQALADFERALEFDIASRQGISRRAALGAARARLGGGQAAAAKVTLDRLLATDPDDVQGLVWRARALRALGRDVQAAADYAQAYASLPAATPPSPEFYLEWANALAGTDEVRARGILAHGGHRLGRPLLPADGTPGPPPRPDSSPLPEPPRAATDDQHALPQPPSLAAQTVVEFGTPMAYLANSADPTLALTWTLPGFDDTGWTAGTYGVGYESGSGPFFADDLVPTVVPIGVSSVYTRLSFNLADSSQVARLFLGCDYDDGFVVWLNGVELYRSASMPAGDPAWNSRPAGRESSNGVVPTYHPIADLSLTGIPLLQDGSNVLAIGVWNAGAGSSDLVLAPRIVLDEPNSVDRGPYLQTGTPTSVIVRWRTNVPTDSKVAYGSSPVALSQSVSDTIVAADHTIALTGLTPDTTYYYSVGSTAATLAGGDADHFFVTPPPAGTGKSTRVWVLGDPGTKSAEARDVRDAYDAFTGAVHTDMWLMLGDNAYTVGLDDQYQGAVFQMYPEFLRKSVLWPTFGNHDGGDSFTQTGPHYEIFDLPRNAEAGGVASGTEAYYSFDYGNIHFICLNSYDIDRSLGGAMMTWLQADVAATTQDWLIAFWHHPPYSKGSHDSDTEVELIEMRTVALPILEAGGVDLVLTGHSHSYERSFLVDGHYGDSTTLTPAMLLDPGDGRPTGDGAYDKSVVGLAPNLGAVYAVAGSSGRLSPAPLDHPVKFLSIVALGSVVLDFDGNRMDAVFLDDTGAQLDTFTILKQGNAKPQIQSLNATPAPVSDDATSQLTVTASDPDLGPDPLSYLWTIDPALGSFDDPSLPNPVFTPPDVGGSTVFTIGVTVSDGEDQATSSLELTVTDADPPACVTLLNEEFDDQELFAWAVTDDGTLQAPSSWGVTAGELSQSSNIHTNPQTRASVPKRGTYFEYQRGSAWADYEFSLAMSSDDNDATGVMFRVADGDDYYRFSWDSQRSYRRLVKSVGGVFTTLGEDAFRYEVGRSYDVRIIADGSDLTVEIDGNTVFQVVDAAHPQGTIALYSWGNQGARFDDLHVSSCAAGPYLPQVTSLTATPQSILDDATTQLAVTADDPDSAPGPLTYDWTTAPAVAIGSGSFDDPTSQTPIWTPPDVEETTSFKLTVTVSDGANDTLASVVVVVHDADATPPLLEDDFADGNFDGWTVVDQGTVLAPSAWDASDGILVQGSDIYSQPLAPSDLPKRGTHIRYDGGFAWANYRLTHKLLSLDDDAVGVLFRVQDTDNYYRFSWDTSRGYRRLVKNLGGNFTELAADTAPYAPGTLYQLQIDVVGPSIKVSIDGSLVFEVVDGGGLAAASGAPPTTLDTGTIAFYSWANAGAVFDDVSVILIEQGDAPVIDTLTATPQVVGDTATSQLEVTAHDPDTSPGPLTYAWSLSPDLGGLDDPNSATPVYTPPDVTSATIITATVAVSDGLNVVLDTINITVTDDDPNPKLLDENFDDQNLDGWTVVDQGTLLAPSAWSAAGGVCTQSTNIYSNPVDPAAIDRLGTHLRYDAGTAWDNYTLELTLHAGDDDALGVMFRVQDADNYYRFSWDAQRTYRRLTKTIDGVFELLAEDNVPYQTSRDYDIRVELESSHIAVYVDDDLVFDVVDGPGIAASLSTGTIALYSWGHDDARFDDIVVSQGAPSDRPVITSLTATPPAITDQQVSALAASATDPVPGPSPLSYAWTATPPGGSFDAPNSPSTNFIPPELLDPETFTVTVTVTDGVDQASDSIEVTVTDGNPPPTLLDDDFDDGDFAGWQVVDEGTALAPSNWTVVEGVVNQGTDIYTPPIDRDTLPKQGTYLEYLIPPAAAPVGWTDVSIRLELRPVDNDAIGVMFRHRGTDDYYRFSWDSQRAYRRLVKNVAGTFTLLDEDAARYNKLQTYDIQIDAIGSSIEIRVDGALVLSANDPDLADGSIALYSWGNAGVDFDDVRVLDMAPNLDGFGATGTGRARAQRATRPDASQRASGHRRSLVRERPATREQAP